MIDFKETEGQDYIYMWCPKHLDFEDFIKKWRTDLDIIAHEKGVEMEKVNPEIWQRLTNDREY